MDKYVGATIKLIAKIGTKIFIVTSFLAGIAFLIASASGANFVVIGILCLTIVPLVILLNGVILYGFGDLVDNVYEIKSRLQNNNLK